MLRINKQGFTLIELMVVIVIIGVLASLAIPRFTEASAKAKAAEAPRVLASYESAYLAAVAEVGADSVTVDKLVFDTASVNKDSKWFNYAAKDKEYKATTASKLGKVDSGKYLQTEYNDDDTFDHTSDSQDLAKLVPNFKAKVSGGGGGGGDDD